MIRQTDFEWGRLGNLEEGRQNLGPEMPVAVYRLMQYTLMDELYARMPKPQAEDVMRGAGYRAGQALTNNLLDVTLDFNSFVVQLQNTLRELRIGVLKIEEMDLENLTFIMTVDEDLDCSGLPVYGETVCFYDEGFIAGILTLYTGRQMQATEIDCWATGGRTCRFHVRPEE